MKSIHIILIITILILTSCSNIKDETYTPNIGSSCKVDSECKIPMDFLVQSNCPFGGACIDSKCKVVCPLTFYDPTLSQSEQSSCEKDSDCNCDNRGEKTIDCKCVKELCFSIEAE